MSLILDALRKAKNLAGKKAPQRAPAYLKSFGFEEGQAEQKKPRKILTTYVIPILILSSVLAGGVIVYIRWAGTSSMQEQAQLLEGGDIFLPENDASGPPDDVQAGLALEDEVSIDGTAAGSEPSAASETPTEGEPVDASVPETTGSPTAASRAGT